MPSIARFFLPPLAALCSAAGATPQSQPPAPSVQLHDHAGPGLSVVRDPESGRLRAPTPSEMRTLQGAASARLQAPAQPAIITEPDGRRHARLGERGLVYAMVERAADGKLDQHCVKGGEAAERALAQPKTSPADTEPRHDRR